jgi:class 3 adenylate cyclase
VGLTWDCAQLSTPWHHPEKTLLEIASESDIEMIAACGGKTICSTCRLEIIEGLEYLEPRGEEETRIAQRLKWADNIRLGCATKFTDKGNVKIRRLITPPKEKRLIKRRAKQDGLGSIRTLAILFIDLKGFTPLSESIPAFDLVYILNRYFTALKEEIVKNNGTINLWVGDELSCVFGINESPNSSYCEDAVQTGIAINKRLRVLSNSLKREFDLEISAGIGIHYGPAVVGNLGPVDDLRFGLVGDAVNVASRIEKKTRDLECDLLISSFVKANLTDSARYFESEHVVELKGVSGSLVVHPFTGVE